MIGLTSLLGVNRTKSVGVYVSTHHRLSGIIADLVIEYLQKSVLRLLARCTLSISNGKAVSMKRRERFAKYDTQVER